MMIFTIDTYIDRTLRTYINSIVAQIIDSDRTNSSSIYSQIEFEEITSNGNTICVSIYYADSVFIDANINRRMNCLQTNDRY